jgi:hypothetical protein
MKKGGKKNEKGRKKKLKRKYDELLKNGDMVKEKRKQKKRKKTKFSPFEVNHENKEEEIEIKEKDDGLNSPKNIRNSKLENIEQIKRCSLFMYLKKLKNIPFEKFLFTYDIQKLKHVVEDFLKKYNDLEKENPLSELDFSVLSKEPNSFFTMQLYETINKMIKYSGIVNDLSSDKIHNYRVYSPEVVSYKDHKDYFREAIGNEHSCIFNDTKSTDSFCLAHKTFGITLRVGPAYPKNTKGLCIFCERFFVNFIFMLHKLRKIPAPFLLNKYRYKIDEPNEYNNTYMNFQAGNDKHSENKEKSQSDDDNFYGIIHYYPMFKPDRYRVTKYNIKRGMTTKVVRGVIEKEDCFF